MVMITRLIALCI